MLILTRKVDQEIVFRTSDGEITIKVLNHTNNNQGNPNYKLGITAPKSINIVRKEIMKRGENFGNR